MGFSKRNSSRSIVQKSPSWKSRELDLGNRHRTTLNFGDIVPAYWQHVLPGDKLKMDCSVLAKFLPLIAPAFSRMKIKSEWFYVPLRQISPPSLRALQDFSADNSETAEYFSKILSGQHSVYTPELSADQQTNLYSGFPVVPAYALAAFMASDTVTLFSPSSGNYHWFDGSTPVNAWRGTSYVGTETTYGMEDLVTYATKKRVSKLLSYFGLPTRLTTMRYTRDVIARPDIYNGEQTGYYSGLPIPQDHRNSFDVTAAREYLNADYLKAMFIGANSAPYTDSLAEHSFVNSLDFSPFNRPNDYGFCSAFRDSISSFDTTTNITRLSNFDELFNGEASEYVSFPLWLSYSRAPISLLPFMAYQKVYNDFYRDEKLQPDEIRLYSYGVSLQDGALFGDYPRIDGSTLPDSNHNQVADFRDLSQYCATIQKDGFRPYNYNGSVVRLFNNLFGLRRRNREKDVFNTCVSSDVVSKSTEQNYVTAYNANLSAKLARYFMKKEFTGSTWAEWLSNFFGENSSDLLNNNVVFLGARESVVSISENIQNSESTESSAQGNRAGLAQDFHNGNSLYFRAPDFGIILCNVSIIPDEIDNFNGLQERFIKACPIDFNLPDLQDIGFTAVLNERMNIGLADRFQNILDTSTPTGVPNFIKNFLSDGAFGFQPFGYDTTYTPNVISGDFQHSLRFWHQSPDLDTDFIADVDPFEAGSAAARSIVDWVDAQPKLNFNLPSIGLRQTPLGSNLAAQYYNNIFAVTSDESGDHCVADMRFFVTCHRNTAFFTDAIADE